MKRVAVGTLLLAMLIFAWLFSADAALGKLRTPAPAQQADETEADPADEDEEAETEPADEDEEISSDDDAGLPDREDAGEDDGSPGAATEDASESCKLRIKVVGKHTDSSENEAVVEATVIAVQVGPDDDNLSNPKKQRGETDDDGTVELEGLPCGPTRITVSARGWNVARPFLPVLPDSERVTIELTPRRP